MTTVRVFSADLHIGLTRNLTSLTLDGVDLRVEDVTLSQHWPLAHGTDPVASWRLLRTIRPSLWRCVYDYARFERFALAMALLYRRYMRRHVDVAYVSFLPHLIHLYRYLDVPVVLHASYRLGGTVESSDYRRLLDLIATMHASGRLRIAASNAYDQHYIKYFTGIDCEVVSIDCGHYRSFSWNPQPGRPFLIAPLRLSEGGQTVAEHIRGATGPAHPLPVIKEQYPGLRADLHARLCEHPGMVVVPYSVHCISTTECFRSGIPLFCPSRRLLGDWHRDHYVLSERKSTAARGRITYDFPIPGAATMPSPTDDEDDAACRWWIDHSDWYEWPVVFFDDPSELPGLLATTDLQAVSRAQLAHSAGERGANARAWRRLLLGSVD